MGRRDAFLFQLGSLLFGSSVLSIPIQSYPNSRFPACNEVQQPWLWCTTYAEGWTVRGPFPFLNLAQPPPDGCDGAAQELR